jgi:DNA repair protein RadC
MFWHRRICLTQKPVIPREGVENDAKPATAAPIFAKVIPREGVERSNADLYVVEMSFDPR